MTGSEQNRAAAEAAQRAGEAAAHIRHDPNQAPGVGFPMQLPADNGQHGKGYDLPEGGRPYKGPTGP